MTISKTLKLIPFGTEQLLPGLRESEERVEVFCFNSPRYRYREEGEHRNRQTIELGDRAYEQLGSPDRIRLTVEAAEDTA